MATATANAGMPGRVAEAGRDRLTSQIRLLVALIVCFAIVPGALLLFVGILVLVFGHQVHDVVFGVLIVALTGTVIAGITFTWVYVRRGTSLARLQGEFVQKVSHDLRTPLTSIRMFIETLQGGRVPAEQQRECLELLNKEATRLSSMVERLLTWAKMESGRRSYLLKPIEPRAIVERALAALEPQVRAAELDGARVHVTRELADHLPLVEADADALSDALWNVLQNALRYTGRDKELSVRVAPGDKHSIEIVIADNGPGIPRHEQSRIFEQFYRVVDPALPNVEGTGLGLAIVHHIVRAHQGRIAVESDVGKGAIFRITLPAAPPRKDA